jgi:predicted DNA-binding transcriptional regulator YafY
MLEAECELRDDFRDLRVERMQTLTPLDARFCDEPGKTPADLMSVVDER